MKKVVDILLIIACLFIGCILYDVIFKNHTKVDVVNSQTEKPKPAEVKEEKPYIELLARNGFVCVFRIGEHEYIVINGQGSSIVHSLDCKCFQNNK